LINTFITNYLLSEARGSVAANQARKLGLKYIGYARYVDPKNPSVTVARTINGKLYRVHSDEPLPDKSEPAKTQIINKGNAPEEIPDPYDSKNIPTLAGKHKPYNVSDFEKKAVATEYDVADHIAKKFGEIHALDLIQSKIDYNQRRMAVYRRTYGQADEHSVKRLAVFQTLKDRMFERVPLKNIGKFRNTKNSATLKIDFEDYKTRRLAHATVDKYGSPEAAISAADKKIAQLEPDQTKQTEVRYIKRLRNIIHREI
jgi:hypothetical protein